jgi:hypothetical protein
VEYIGPPVLNFHLSLSGGRGALFAKAERSLSIKNIGQSAPAGAGAARPQARRKRRTDATIPIAEGDITLDNIIFLIS